jgi:hypothetical protein
MMLFDKSMPKGIFRLEIEKVGGGWRKRHTEELHKLYRSLSTRRFEGIRRLVSVGFVVGRVALKRVS